jgi:uncharacterized damage-inducible protein DinB
MADFAERIAQIKSRLATAREYLDSVLDSVGDRWETPVYSDGAAWNVRQLLIHMSIAEAGIFRRIQGIVNGEEDIPTDFDLERYNKRSVEKNADMSPEQARANLNAAREKLNAWVDDLSSEDILGLQGLHPTMRMMTVEEMLNIVAWHERDHAQDIAKALEGTA